MCLKFLIQSVLRMLNHCFIVPKKCSDLFLLFDLLLALVPESSMETNSKPESKTSHPAVVPPPAAVSQSSSFISGPTQAHQEKIRARETRTEGEKNKPSRPKREKTYRSEKEEEKCSRTEREAERLSERGRERGLCKELEKGKRMEKEKEHRRKSLHRRNQAARVIQTAWRRY